jgi:hypothetical protein
MSGNEIHVTPLNDLREHEDSAQCWCKPTPDEECPRVLVHHALDGREAFETGQRQPS